MTKQITIPEPQLNEMEKMSKLRKYANLFIFGLFALIALSFVISNPDPESLG